MTPTLGSLNLESQEINLEVIRRFTIDTIVIQAQGAVAYNQIIAQPPTAFQNFAATIRALGQRLQITLQPHALPSNRRSAIGLREMHLSEQNVADLHRHIEHPSALPRLPLRAIPEEEAEELY